LGLKGMTLHRSREEYTMRSFNDLYSSPNIIQVIKSRRMRWAGHVACMGGEGHTGFWWGNMREKDPLEDPEHRRENDDIMDLQEMAQRGMDWTDLTQNRNRWRVLVNVVMNFGFHKMWEI